MGDQKIFFEISNRDMFTGEGFKRQCVFYLFFSYAIRIKRNNWNRVGNFVKTNQKKKKGNIFFFKPIKIQIKNNFEERRKKIKQVSNWGRRKNTKHVWIMVALSSYSKFKKKVKIFKSIREKQNTHLFVFFFFNIWTRVVINNSDTIGGIILTYSPLTHNRKKQGEKKVEKEFF